MLTAERRVSIEGVVLDLAMDGFFLLEGAEGQGGGHTRSEDMR